MVVPIVHVIAVILIDPLTSRLVVKSSRGGKLKSSRLMSINTPRQLGPVAIHERVFTCAAGASHLHSTYVRAVLLGAALPLAEDSCTCATRPLHISTARFAGAPPD